MTYGQGSPITRLPRFLTWEAGSDLVRTACEIYVRWAYGRLRQWSTTGGTDLFDAATKLPKPSQQRLLLAPWSFHLLQSAPLPRPDQVESIRGFISTEEYMASQEGEPPSDSWTALGDYYFPGKNNLAGKKSWYTGGFFKAPVVGHMVVDGYSPYSDTRFPEEFGELHPHSLDGLSVVTERVAESLDHIREVSPVAGAVVDACVQAFTVVRAPAHEQMTASMSLRSMIGRVGLINMESRGWNVAKLSNAIVHEAIHSLIYKLELQEALYTDADASENCTAVSPWSGRTLKLHSFVHACFVWFGLLCFWNRSGDQSATALRLQKRALSGFLAGPPLSAISGECYAGIQPPVRAAIEEMYEYVTRNRN